MWEEILRLAVGNGLWAVLFCCLLAYLLRDGRARESKYQKTIDALSEHLSKIDDVKNVATQTLRVVKNKKVRAETATSDAVNSNFKIVDEVKV